MKNCPLADIFSETYGVISYDSGGRKDVVNPCLEFGLLSPGRLAQVKLKCHPETVVKHVLSSRLN